MWRRRPAASAAPGPRRALHRPLGRARGIPRSPAGPTRSRSRCRCTPRPGSPARSPPTYASPSAATGSTRRCAVDVADRRSPASTTPSLVRWVEGTTDGTDGRVQLGRDAAALELPARELLPPLDRYAHLALGGEERVVGYVEASHGCAHRCRHCPVPVVYDGRIRIVDVGHGARRRRPAGRGRRAPHHLRRPRLPQRRAPLAAGRAGGARALPRAHLRLHREGRARPAPRRASGASWPTRAASSSSPRSSRSTTRSLERLDKGHTAADAARGRRRCCASTASRSAPRGCRSRRGRRSTTCATSSSSSPTTT